jgi:hypothetical protein
MIDELRRNNQRFRVEIGGVENLLQRIPDGAESPAPQELPVRRRKKKLVIQVDARFWPFLNEVDQRIVHLAGLGLNQAEIGENLGLHDSCWTAPCSGDRSVYRLSQVAVSKRIKRIKAEERKWKAKQCPVHWSKHVDAGSYKTPSIYIVEREAAQPTKG